jgi:hypothetical protein
MRAAARLVVSIGLVLSPRVGQAQHEHVAHAAVPAGGDSAVADFARRARQGALRYVNQAAAVADGYRRLGPDFPAMGEHWANPELVARGVLDPLRPPLLTYIRVNGAPRLTGVVFAVPLADGERPPASPFAPGAWHDHFGSVEDESLLLDHDAQQAPPGELRLAVLHGWLFVDNPDGLWTTDNWALPYARVGVPVPPVASPGATRAVALIGGALPYYEALAERAIGSDSAALERMVTTLERHRAAMTSWWERRAPGAPLRDAELAALAEMWRTCWTDVARGASPDAAARLERIAR